MKEKRILYREIAYVLGLIVLAVGTALMERADFGMSMVVAPAYLFYVKVSAFLPFFTFGMAEYVFQALLLVVLIAVMRRVKKSYLFSFATAVLYGFLLDAVMIVADFIPFEGLVWSVIFYVAGLVICSCGVALLFHTYIPLEVYEMIVKEFSEKFKQPIGRVKTVYDCCSCLLGLVLSFLFFGFGVFVGVKWGTVVCAVVNGWLIGRISGWLDRSFRFEDLLPRGGKSQE